MRTRALAAAVPALATAMATGIALLAGAPAFAQQYPSKPVKLLVTIPPGGAPDIAGRVIADRLSVGLGQPFVVENRAGSNGNIAMELAARAAPDGYTIVIAADSMVAINPHLYTKMPLDTQKDLVPVTGVATNQFVLTINPSVPARTFREFIEYARTANPVLAYASGGNGSQHQMAMEMLKARAGINLTHVPYKGGAPATTATVAGEVAGMFAGTSSAGQVRAGKLRALSVTGKTRSAAFPDLPTIGEIYPGYELTIWLALFAPAGTPEAAMARLRDEAHKQLGTAEVKQRLAGAGGLEPWPAGREEVAAAIRSDYEKYGKLVKQIGASLD